MPDLWRPALADFVQAAAVILDIDPDRIQRLPGLRLAESALQAPFSGVGDQHAYPEVSERAAVLIDTSRETTRYRTATNACRSP